MVKVKNFDVEEYIIKKLTQHCKQASKLRELYELLTVMPEADITINWYGFSDLLQIDMNRASTPSDMPERMALQGIELKKTFDEYRGEFSYKYQSGRGSIMFSAVPENCKIIKKTRYVKEKAAHTETYYEADCNNNEEVEQK